MHLSTRSNTLLTNSALSIECEYMTDSTNRGLITIMIVIGIIIIILFFTKGVGTGPVAYTGGNYYAASAVPFSNTTTTTAPVVLNGGYYPVVVKRTIPISYRPSSTNSNTTYTTSDGTQMTTTYTYQQ